MATLKQRLHRKNGSSYDTIHLETNATVVKMSTTDNTTLSTKIKNIDTEMNSVKTSVSNGKSLIASAITDKGVSTASNATFQTMANNISQIKSGVSVPVFGENFNYTGEYQILSDGNDNWRIKFLTSGTFTPLDSMAVDVFLVGGGGGGQAPGGGGGYTTTVKSLVLTANTEYPITVGAGGTAGAIMLGTNGGSSEAFSCSAAGGERATSANQGGNGGSGGGASVQSHGGNGGSDGGDGGKVGSGGNNGKVQGTTTREFGESTGDLYAGGGGGKENGLGGAGGGGDYKENGEANTGGGGGGAGAGGSGIVIIRNHRE